MCRYRVKSAPSPGPGGIVEMMWKQLRSCKSWWRMKVMAVVYVCIFRMREREFLCCGLESLDSASPSVMCLFFFLYLGPGRHLTA